MNSNVSEFMTKTRQKSRLSHDMLTFRQKKVFWKNLDEKSTGKKALNHD